LLLMVGTINLVHAGISVTVVEVDPSVSVQGGTATYTVRVESITTEDENMQLTVIHHDDLQPSWTFREAFIGVGATETFDLEVTYSGTASGNFPFTVAGEAWPVTYNYSQAIDLGLLERSSYTDYVLSAIPQPSPPPPSPTPEPSPTSSVTTPAPTSEPAPTPTDSTNPTPAVSPTQTPTDTSSPLPADSPSSSPSAPPDETSATLYIFGGVGVIAAIIVIIFVLRFKK
jgi:hypothetical protein